MLTKEFFPPLISHLYLLKPYSIPIMIYFQRNSANNLRYFSAFIETLHYSYYALFSKDFSKKSMTFLESQDLILLLSWIILLISTQILIKETRLYRKYASFCRLLENHLSFENFLFLKLYYKLIFSCLENIFHSTKMKCLQLLWTWKKKKKKCIISLSRI